jgi:hypothetical protein
MSWASVDQWQPWYDSQSEWGVMGCGHDGHRDLVALVRSCKDHWLIEAWPAPHSSNRVQTMELPRTHTLEEAQAVAIAMARM